jgi:hypothetical protein
MRLPCRPQLAENSEATPTASIVAPMWNRIASARVQNIMNVAPRSWITAGWVFIAATAGLVIAAIVQALGAVSSTCAQPLATSGSVDFTCPGAGAEFVRGLICAAGAGVAFFSGLACFFWAAHLRSLRQATRIRQSQAGTRHRLFD